MKVHPSLPIVVASLALVGGACDRSSPDADNTARNRRDTSPTVKTPMAQSNESADIRITAEIRRAIMDDKSMSVNARNCKIITEAGGVVTLRGPVDSQAERDSIESKARAVPGVTRIVNEMEVTTNHRS